MLLNRVEYALMNNPLRAFLQRHVEAPRLAGMGGEVRGAAALELGCGRGVGTELILARFRAHTVDAFDLDRRMVTVARDRLRRREVRARLWVGDATGIAVADASYDAVFDFGVIHHVPEWRRVLAEVARVLKPGGRFVGEEVLRRWVQHPLSRWLLEHPQLDRFDGAEFRAGLEEAGLTLVAYRDLWNGFAWFVADKQAAA